MTEQNFKDIIKTKIDTEVFNWYELHLEVTGNNYVLLNTLTIFNDIYNKEFSKYLLLCGIDPNENIKLLILNSKWVIENFNIVFEYKNKDIVKFTRKDKADNIEFSEHPSENLIDAELSKIFKLREEFFKQPVKEENIDSKITNLIYDIEKTSKTLIKNNYKGVEQILKNTLGQLLEFK